MKDSNKLIAEFMNLNIVTLDDIRSNKNPMISSADGYTVDSLQYHTSWDWLMPVVRKCLDVYQGIWKADFDRYSSKNLASYESSIRTATGSANRETTYRVVTEFINWYNKNKKA